MPGAEQKVREIFESALRRKPDERRRFVNEVCGDDTTLLAEVESLLSSHNNAESYGAVSLSPPKILVIGCLQSVLTNYIANPVTILFVLRLFKLPLELISPT